jgi:transcriptional regulator NrdR family protein
MEKTWKDYPAMECPKCNSTDSEVLTKSKKDDWVYDQEDARCKSCGHTGYVVVEDSECADIIWHTDEELTT